VLFDKIASVFILVEKYIHILALEMANRVNQRGPIGLHDGCKVSYDHGAV